MQRFVIEREIPGAGAMSPDELKEVSKKSVAVLGEIGVGVQWLHSYVTDDKIYCVYYATSPELIEEHARCVGIPANKISAVHDVIDPTTAND